jgi:hypothetical protein
MRLDWLTVLALLLLLQVAVLLSAAKRAAKGKRKSNVQDAKDVFHTRSEQYKTQTGWQEPGLWRPKWIMDRTFTDKEGEITVRDRIYLKLKPDKTIRVYSAASRPRIKWLKSKADKEVKAKKMFESGDEKVTSTEEQIKMYEDEQDAFNRIDGTWTFMDEIPAKSARVKIETAKTQGDDTNTEAEGEEYDEEEYNMASRVLHDGRCDWGTLDGYAAKFRRGKLLKYKVRS